jgi:hypothetical protein
VGPDLTELRADDNSGGNHNARIIADLPKEGTYYVRAGQPNSDATYTLRIVEPRPLSFDRPQTSTAVSDTLWLVAGQAGQVVNLTISPSPDDMTPRLSLMDASGQNVASGVVSPAEGYERIPAAILPNDGRLLVQVGPIGARTPYTLTLTAVEPRPLAFDQPATSTTISDTLWTMNLAAGQVLDNRHDHHRSELRSLPDRTRRQRRQPGQQRRQRRQHGCTHQPIHSAGAWPLHGARRPAGQRSALHAGGAHCGAAAHRAGRDRLVHPG